MEWTGPGRVWLGERGREQTTRGEVGGPGEAQQEEQAGLGGVRSGKQLRWSQVE